MEQLLGAIPTVLKSIDSHAAVDEAIVFASWSRCAGVLLRERTIPLRFIENRLVIAVPDVTWQRHLEELSPQMLVKVNSLLGQGTVKFIEFRIDELAVNSAKKTRTEPTSDGETVFAVTPSLKAAADGISDEGLRNQFLSAARSYLAKQRSN